MSVTQLQRLARRWAKTTEKVVTGGETPDRGGVRPRKMKIGTIRGIRRQVNAALARAVKVTLFQKPSKEVKGEIVEEPPQALILTKKPVIPDRAAPAHQLASGKGLNSAGRRLIRRLASRETGRAEALRALEHTPHFVEVAIRKGQYTHKEFAESLLKHQKGENPRQIEAARMAREIGSTSVAELRAALGGVSRSNQSRGGKRGNGATRGKGRGGL